MVKHFQAILQKNYRKRTLQYRFSRRITSQLQNWIFLTYLRGEPRNTYISPMQESQNVSNTSRHQEVVVWLLNLPCYSHFSCLENFKHLFWKIMIFAVVTLFFWRSNTWMNIVIENDHMIEHLWTCLSNFRPQNFAKEVNVHMLLVHYTIIWQP